MPFVYDNADTISQSEESYLRSELTRRGLNATSAAEARMMIASNECRSRQIPTSYDYGIDMRNIAYDDDMQKHR